MAGILYLCATPIGNLEDMTYRCVRILKEVDLIAAEDTRNSLKLLNHFEINTPMTSYHEFNKIEKAKKLMETLTQLESEYGVAWQCRPESDEAIARIDYVLQKVCGGYFQPFFERNDLIKDWWDK